MDKKIDEKQLAALEQERNEALVRVVNRVRQSQNTGLGAAAHNSHASASRFRGHRAHSASPPEHVKSVSERLHLAGEIKGKLLRKEDLSAAEGDFVLKLVAREYASLNQDMRDIKNEPEANRRHLIALCLRIF